MPINIKSGSLIKTTLKQEYVCEISTLNGTHCAPESTTNARGEQPTLHTFESCVFT